MEEENNTNSVLKNVETKKPCLRFLWFLIPAVILLLAYFYYFILPQLAPKVSGDNYTIRQLETLCKRTHCPEQKITVDGIIFRSSDSHGIYDLEDDKGKNHAVINMNMARNMEFVAFEEESGLIDGSKFSAQIKAKVRYEKHFCTMNNCDYYVTLFDVNLEDIKIIKKVGCIYEAGCTPNPFKRTEAYKTAIDSGICQSDKYDLSVSGFKHNSSTPIFDPPLNGTGWIFAIQNDEKRGFYDSVYTNCFVSKKHVILYQSFPGGQIKEVLEVKQIE